MAAWRLVSGLGGLARERYRGETKTLCSVEKLPAEGRPGLACLELPTAVVKSGRPRTRSARSSRIASVPTDAARRGCVACDFLVATADREDFFASRTLAEATQTTCRAPDATQYLTGGSASFSPSSPDPWRGLVFAMSRGLLSAPVCSFSVSYLRTISVDGAPTGNRTPL